MANIQHHAAPADPKTSLTERQRRLNGLLEAALVTEQQRRLDDFLKAALDKLNDMDRATNEHLTAKKPWWHRLTWSSPLKPNA